MGVALLFNEYNGIVEMRIFLFAFANNEGNFGSQASMLPPNRVAHNALLRSGLLELLFTLCTDVLPQLKISPPFQLEAIHPVNLSFDVT